MKQKKKPEITENETINQWRKRFALGKRSALRQKQKENDELERKKVFERKTSEASDKKAPVTLRTRGYYRFAKEYPSAVDENGFRANQPGRKTVLRRRILTAVFCLIAFSLAFVITKYTMLVSQKPLPESEPSSGASDSQPFRALRFSYDELRTGDTEGMLRQLEENDCTAAVFEFKDDKGYVLFNTGSFMGMSADHRIPHAEDTVKLIKSKGYTVCAYISCFKDSAASEADLTYSVRQNTYEGASWRDNSGVGWLDPFSPPARSYVLDIIENAAKKGFDRILLGNVCFSSDSGTAAQYYAWESDSQYSRNQALITFINSAVKSAGSAKITVLCDTAAYGAAAIQDVPRYFGNLLTGQASSLCVDARLSAQQKNIKIGADTFSDPSLMPYVFVLAAAEYGVNAMHSPEMRDTEALVCIERGSSIDEQLTAVGFSGADGYIIW